MEYNVNVQHLCTNNLQHMQLQQLFIHGFYDHKITFIMHSCQFWWLALLLVDLLGFSDNYEKYKFKWNDMEWWDFHCL